MRPPRSRTWGRRGITPVIRVRGGGTGRVSVAGLACYRPGDRSRQLPGGNVVLVWDYVARNIIPPPHQRC